MGEPTVKPLASLAIAVMETGALADLPALSAPLVTVESLHPASKRLAETSAAGKTFNSDLNVMAIELNRPGRGVKAKRQALKKTARGCKAYRLCACANVKLSVNIFDMRVHGLPANEQPRTNFRTGVARCHQL